LSTGSRYASPYETISRRGTPDGRDSGRAVMRLYGELGAFHVRPFITTPAALFAWPVAAGKFWRIATGGAEEGLRKDTSGFKPDLHVSGRESPAFQELALPTAAVCVPRGRNRLEGRPLVLVEYRGGGGPTVTPEELPWPRQTYRPRGSPDARCSTKIGWSLTRVRGRAPPEEVVSMGIVAEFVQVLYLVYPAKSGYPYVEVRVSGKRSPFGGGFVIRARCRRAMLLAVRYWVCGTAILLLAKLWPTGRDDTRGPRPPKPDVLYYARIHLIPPRWPKLNKKAKNNEVSVSGQPHRPARRCGNRSSDRSEKIKPAALELYRVAGKNGRRQLTAIPSTDPTVGDRSHRYITSWRRTYLV